MRLALDLLRYELFFMEATLGTQKNALHYRIAVCYKSNSVENLAYSYRLDNYLLKNNSRSNYRTLTLTVKENRLLLIREIEEGTATMIQRIGRATRKINKKIYF